MLMNFIVVVAVIVVVLAVIVVVDVAAHDVMMTIRWWWRRYDNIYDVMTTDNSSDSGFSIFTSPSKSQS